MPARPFRSQTASTTDSRTVNPANSVLIWNVRVMPSLTRWCCGSAVIRSSPRNTSPEVGTRAPVSRLMIVVLPAPFGPIKACRTPCGNASVTSLAALNAPNCFDSPDVRNAAVTITCL